MFWGFVQPVTVFSKVKRESVHRSVTDVPAPYTASEAERGSAPQTFTEELALCLWDSFLRDAGLAARSSRCFQCERQPADRSRTQQPLCHVTRTAPTR